MTERCKSRRFFGENACAQLIVRYEVATSKKTGHDGGCRIDSISFANCALIHPCGVCALCEACALASAMGSYNPPNLLVQPHGLTYPLRRIRLAMRSCIARRYE